MKKRQKQSAVFLFVALIGISIVSCFCLRFYAEASANRTVFTNLKSNNGETSWNGKIAVLSKSNRCTINDYESTSIIDIPKQVMHDFEESISGNTDPVRLTSLEGLAPVVERLITNVYIVRATY
jgi:hypothetical protein